MISYLPKIHLPDEFTKLLRININKSNDPIAWLADYLSEKPSFELFVKKKLGIPLDKDNILKLLQRKGWQNFRNDLASIYLFYNTFKKFPDRPVDNQVKNILEKEQFFSSSFVSGYSRCFLLMIYFEFVDTELKNKGEKLIFGNNKVLLEVSNLINDLQIKTEKIDWIILILYHYCSFLGSDLVTKLLKNGEGSYFKLYEKLHVNDQSMFCNNLLSYAEALDENDYFVSYIS